MSALGAVLGKRTWLGAGAILLAAAGGCALGALLVVKGVLPEGGALAWGCGCWALAAFAGGRVAVRGRGEGTLTAALAAGAAAYLLAWLVGAAIGDPTFRTGGLYLTAAIFGGAGAAAVYHNQNGVAGSAGIGRRCGGGGGGELLTYSGQSLSVTSYTIKVGAGGAASSAGGTSVTVIGVPV